jgi:hypothetical protein
MAVAAMPGTRVARPTALGARDLNEAGSMLKNIRPRLVVLRFFIRDLFAGKFLIEFRFVFAFF